jgi:conjugative transfer region protein TrbK
MSDLKAFRALTLSVTIFVVVLAAACTIHLREDNQPQPASLVVQEGDPVAAELERCRSISYEQKDRLAECRKVWTEQRRQFLGQSSNPARPEPAATPSASAKDQSRLPSGLFPTPQPTER